jgi:hypothetical protein
LFCNNGGTGAGIEPSRAEHRPECPRHDTIFGLAGNMQSIQIHAVSNSGDLKQFVDLPWKIYKDDPNWVPPIKKLVRDMLDVRKHPFWEFSEQALFLAKRNGDVVGRIAGIIDRNYISYHSENVCGWGFFECEDNMDTAKALFQAVEDWASSKGLEFLRGPLNPSTNYEVALLIEGFDSPPPFMMTYNPEYYVKLVESFGFEKEKDLLSLRLHRGDQLTARMERLAGRIERKTKVRVRNLNMKDLRSEVRLCCEIYNAAWSRNWGFVPMTEREGDAMAAMMRHTADPELMFFLYYDDEPVGVCLGAPDINPWLKSLNGKIGLLGLFKYLKFKRDIASARIFAMGYKPSHQKLGLFITFFYHIMKVCVPRTYRWLDMGWNLEDNYDIIKLETAMGAKINKRYRIYRKDL